MKSIWPVLAIAALLGTTEAVFLDFSERNFQKYFNIDRNCVRSNANLFNFDYDIEFLAATPEEGRDVAEFYENPQPEHPRPTRRHLHPECRDFIGIYIQDAGRSFCRPGVIEVRVDDFRGELPGITPDIQVIYFRLLFRLSGTEPFSLKVPLLRKPPVARSFEGENLKNWVKQNRIPVGLWAPVPLRTLRTASAIRKMTVDFLWLDKLLLIGLARSSVPDYLPDWELPIDTYVTRPILVEDVYLQACLELITTLNDPDAQSESEGSNSPD